MTSSVSGRTSASSDRVPRRAARLQLNEEAAIYVRSLILARRLVEGQTVSVEPVVRDLEMSATPVREALLSLRAEGFLTLEPRRGFIVAPLSDDDLRDLWGMHAYTAGELAARAADRATPALARTLSDLQDRMAKAARVGRQEQVEELNFEFHRTINHAANSPKLLLFLRLALKYVPARSTDDIPGWREATLEDHVAIIDALEQGDATKARDHMGKHIQHAEDLFLSHHRQVAEGNVGSA